MYNAFRLFEEDLKISPSTASPLDLLEAFAREFGNDINVGKKNLGKFGLYTTAPGRFLDPIWSNKASPNYTVQATIRYNEQLDRTEVAVAYSVDVDKYAKTLIRRGIAPIFLDKRLS